ncbi:hypothetical protein BCR33DRAFT_715139 [Rhizoclosmatium globosum]|uniref:Uncharacterized protein n=1 Tax=Rhizoclosmatium globosum TaxID=329046 RepID=A0A1Y2CK79_9FUNG|nr:hypothetical protein BCR33DRAFT_715139 [Rhizoclosmatium globosum]|eukprot:ORY47421.1 hypothetical protein BCR33DRAFT_715139 [Rhizoclosmatium globosum]
MSKHDPQPPTYSLQHQQQDTATFSPPHYHTADLTLSLHFSNPTYNTIDLSLPNGTNSLTFNLGSDNTNQTSDFNVFRPEKVQAKKLPPTISLIECAPPIELKWSTSPDTCLLLRPYQIADTAGFKVDTFVPGAEINMIMESPSFKTIKTPCTFTAPRASYTWRRGGGSLGGHRAEPIVLSTDTKVEDRPKTPIHASFQLFSVEFEGGSGVVSEERVVAQFVFQINNERVTGDLVPVGAWRSENERELAAASALVCVVSIRHRQLISYLANGGKWVKKWGLW